MYDPYSKKSVLGPFVKDDLDKLKKQLDVEFGFDILTRSGKRIYADARRVFVNILNDKYDLKSKGNSHPKLLTTTLLAEYIGLQNHTSVMHLLRNFDMILKQNAELRIIYYKYSQDFKEYDDKEQMLLLKKQHYLDLAAKVDEELEELWHSQREDYKEKIAKNFGNKSH